MTQHTRVYLDSGGNVIHVATSEAPFGREPIQAAEIVGVRAVVFDAVPRRFIRARELLGVLLSPVTAKLRWSPGAALLIKDIRNEGTIR